MGFVKDDVLVPWLLMVEWPTNLYRSQIEVIGQKPPRFPQYGSIQIFKVILVNSMAYQVDDDGVETLFVTDFSAISNHSALLFLILPQFYHLKVNIG